MKNKIKEYLRTLGIEKCGIAHIGGKSAVVCLFPYYNGDAGGIFRFTAADLIITI